MSVAQGAEAPVRIPLLIGVTGHRDLLAQEVPQLREAVRHYLEGLQRQYPQAPLRVMTPLSAGADLLVAEEALSLGLECVAVLPLPLDLYRKDFEDPAELSRFEQALGRCYHSFVCPKHRPDAVPGAEEREPDREASYARTGELIASLSFVLLALWDGRSAEKPAGTAQTVEYRLTRRAWTDDAKSLGSEDLLPNLPPDLVYHIVTSRRSGAPADGLVPLQQGYRCNLGGPFESHIPGSAILVAVRIAEINASLCRHAAAIDHDGASAALMADVAHMPQGLAEAARMFGAVDWLARRMRHHLIISLYSTSGLMIAMGAMFLGYGFREHYPVCRYLIVGFLFIFLVLLCVNFMARRREWHRKHLEFRALAEGLRVELFWAAAGVTARGAAAEHRGLLKQADPGLDWILNAIRAASLSLAECQDTGIPGGVEFAIRHWVGTVSKSGKPSEQLQYYWHAARSKAKSTKFAEHAAGGFVALGFLLAVILAVKEFVYQPQGSDYLAFIIGMFSLTGGVIEALVEKTAERELQRQYEYMYDVLLAAHDRFLTAQSKEERRTVLALLGRAALDEHAAWLLVHRDRPVYRSRLQ